MNGVVGFLAGGVAGMLLGLLWREVLILLGRIARLEQRAALRRDPPR